ncbi:HAD family hydrolase [Agaribacterium sp. ZY112]|uniref:histidinol-phosphatase n=1 Tax=Agaribacterium sp. ZY112 TaxID=3233574 RepID=UPI003525D1AC
MTLAIFDLDNTLIAGDSDHSWGEFLVEKKLVDGEQFQRDNDRFYEDYCKGQLDIHAYLRFALKPLSRYSEDELKQLHNEFTQEKILPLWLPKAEALVEKHRQQGDQLLVITATNDFITRPIVERFGIEQLLASEGEIINGRYTGEAKGIPSYAEGKVERLKQWLSTQEQQHDLDEAYFYSDSRNDLPLLEKVGNPIAVDPDAFLADTAEAKGWPIISLR